MVTICSETKVINTISNTSICGKLVKIYDIKPTVGTITLLIDNSEIVPGVGKVSIVRDGKRLNIQLISKNVAAGTANISFIVEEIIVEPTHYLNIEVKPYSWYNPSGVANHLVRNIVNLDGMIINTFADVIGWEYVGIDILPKEDKVIIRISLIELESMGTGVQIQSMIAPLVIAKVALIVIASAIILIGVGFVTGFFWSTPVRELLFGKTYTAKEVFDIVMGGGEFGDGVVGNQLIECDKITNSIEKADCYRRLECGAANGLSDAFNDPTMNCESQEINEKVGSCVEQYRIDGDSSKLDICLGKMVEETKESIGDKVPEEEGLAKAIMMGAMILGIAYVASGRS